jgi:ATP phosphoribosyltransferase
MSSQLSASPAPFMPDSRPPAPEARSPFHLALPKGRMHQGVVQLLADAGIAVTTSARGYRPTISLAGVETKILKPQNIVEMLHTGSRDAGFAGADWVAELNAEGGVVQVLDLGLDPVRIVAAAPRRLVDDGWPPNTVVRVASEMENLSRRWIAGQGLNAEFVRSFGATEVLPPEDADCIVDVAASGATLEANGLVIIDELMRSSTRLYASRAAMADPAKRRRIENLAMLLESVLAARKRVMLEVNVTAESLAGVVAVLPCMRQPTISTLHAGAGFAVKAAVPRELLPTLIPDIKARGGTDLVITPLAQVVP